MDSGITTKEIEQADRNKLRQLLHIAIACFDTKTANRIKAKLDKSKH